jgi:hypothetical protein
MSYAQVRSGIVSIDQLRNDMLVVIIYKDGYGKTVIKYLGNAFCRIFRICVLIVVYPYRENSHIISHVKFYMESECLTYDINHFIREFGVLVIFHE